MVLILLVLHRGDEHGQRLRAGWAAGRRQDARGAGVSGECARVRASARGGASFGGGCVSSVGGLCAGCMLARSGEGGGVSPLAVEDQVAFDCADRQLLVLRQIGG